MFRFCSKCKSERSLHELFCEGLVDGKRCDWNLSDEPIRQAGWVPPVTTIVAPPEHRHCTNGHLIGPADLMCTTCGADPADETNLPTDSDPTPTDVIIVDGWRLVEQISSIPRARDRYIAERVEDQQRALLTLYHYGAEPDPSVYEVLNRISLEHIPEIYATGRWDDRAYEVSEILTGGVLSDLGIVASDAESITRIVCELGQALHAFSEVGLRHRDLQPATLLVRSREPLDLVISDFGSARLSDFDLDIVSPLEITRYMAPEAIAGGVAAASDWWSLGIILLEQITAGECFKDINERAYLIHILANGVILPDNLDPKIDLLLRGLLARDRHQRWQWPQVQAWLAGEAVTAPPAVTQAGENLNAPGISLNNKVFRQPALFALAAAEHQHWNEARDHLLRGVLVTWAQAAGVLEKPLSGLRHIAQLHSISEDFRLMLALKLLNPEMPLIYQGDIVTPGWLLKHPLEGYQLITGAAPDLLDQLSTETWLMRLKVRADAVRLRIKNLGIPIDEDSLRVNLLSTSRARLAVVWEERRRLFPDASHQGLLSITERTTISEEDLIVLLSAETGQFRSCDAIVEEAIELAKTHNVATADFANARTWISLPRLELLQHLNERIASFAQCSYPTLNEWADGFRVEKRLPLTHALVLLSIPEREWLAPKKQQYISQLLEFFEKRISSSVLRGALVRMTLSKSGARVGLCELGTERVPAAAILDHLLQRNTQPVTLDPAAFAMTNNNVEARLHSFARNTALYRRDTGIDGGYLGFPFLLVRDNKSNTKTRVAPLLLWPVRLNIQLGGRGLATLAFDNDREEVRLNPALEALLGIDATKQWRKVADELLSRSALKAGDIMDAFGLLAKSRGRTLRPFESPATELPLRTQELECSAVLFHVTFIGQAIGEDLRLLKNLPIAGTALETALRINTTDAAGDEPVTAIPQLRELDRFFTVSSDPSQEASVLMARQSPGLLIEGPPGTGKSQTIVNMVGDAIGQRRSLLIVCQKHAALEVVYKRLVAEGLGDRIVMINDVNKDRNPVIKMIREQLESLHRRVADPCINIKRKREETAARIESLEGELNRYHTALHNVDDQLGISYRVLLGELVGIEHPVPPLDLPALRAQIKGCSVSELAGLEEEIAPLVQYWLPAKFENNYLVNLQVFASDQATVTAFHEVLQQFLQTESERAAILLERPGDFEVDEPALQQQWLAAHAQKLLDLSDIKRSQLARWLPLFRSANQENTAGHQLINRISELCRDLTKCATQNFNESFSVVLTALSSDQLEHIQECAAEQLAPSTWTARLNPFRFFRKRFLYKFLASRQQVADQSHIAALHRCCELEAQWRPLREALTKIHDKLQLPPIGLDSGPSLLHDAKITRTLFGEVAELAATIALSPWSKKLDAAVTKDSRTELVKVYENFDAAFARHAARQQSLDALSRLDTWVEADWLQACRAAIQANESNQARLVPLELALPNLPAYQYFRRRAQRLSESAIAIFSILRTLDKSLSLLMPAQLDGEVRRIIKREARLGWKQLLEQKNPDLQFEPDELEKKVASLALLDIDMRKLNREFLQQDFDLTAIGRPSVWEDITRLTGHRARRLREFMELGAKLGLMKLRPVWLMNPDVASRVLPLQSAMFDAVVYDEASQMRVEHALPSLYRGSLSIISGDEKQMPPTTFFGSKAESDEAEVYDGEVPEDDATDEERDTFDETWNRREIKDCPDLLQLARTNLPSTTLQIHYRSAYRELIEFSNACFYGNHMSVPVRHPDTTIQRVRPIEVVRTDTVYQEQTNPGEASKVVDILADMWLQPYAARPSVGVVTFNRKQADLIEELLEARAEIDEDFRLAYGQERDRIEDGEDMGAFVKNVENVQGDERDIIIFSSTFGRNSQGTFRRNFGVLGQKGGERRLNVAVTRARRKVIMVTSMAVNDISDILSTNRSLVTPRDFLQGYMEYARMISGGDLAGSRSLLARMRVTRTGQDQQQDKQNNDGVTRSVRDYIESLGRRVTFSSAADIFGLDMAIEDSATGLFAIGIECDAPCHDLLTQARAREIWRPNVLRRAVPHIHRVYSHAWYHSPEHERERLRLAIEKAFTPEA